MIVEGETLWVTIVIILLSHMLGSPPNGLCVTYLRALIAFYKILPVWQYVASEVTR